MQSRTIFKIAGELADNLGHYPIYIGSARSLPEKKRRANSQKLMKRKIRLLTDDLSSSLALIMRNN